MNSWKKASIKVSNKLFHHRFSKESHISEYIIDTKIDEIIEDIGYGRVQIILAIAMTLVFLIDGLIGGFLSNLLVPLAGYYGVSDFSIQFTTAFYLLGSALASITVGSITKEYGRVNIIKIAFSALLFFYFLIVMIKSLAVMGIALFFIGYSICTGMVLLLNILIESIPVKNRSISLLMINIVYLLGLIVNNLSIMAISPNFEFYQTQKVLLANWVLIFLCSLVIIFLVRDSPRNLAIMGKTDEAVKSLCEMISPSKLVVSKEAKAKLIKEFTSRANAQVQRDYSSLFGDKFKLMSVKQTFINFFAFAILNGCLAILEPLLKLNHHLSDYDINIFSIYIFLIAIGLALVFSAILNLKQVGFIIMIYVTYGLFIALLLAAIFSENSLHTLLLFSGGIVFNAVNIVSTYSQLVYPTVIRDISAGYLLFMGKIGGFIFQIIFGMLFEKDYRYPLWLSIGMMILGIILPVSFLKHDVNTVPLDDEGIIESRSDSTVNKESETEKEKLNDSHPNSENSYFKN